MYDVLGISINIIFLKGLNSVHVALIAMGNFFYIYALRQSFIEFMCLCIFAKTISTDNIVSKTFKYFWLVPSVNRIDGAVFTFFLTYSRINCFADTTWHFPISIFPSFCFCFCFCRSFFHLYFDYDELHATRNCGR